MKIQSFGDIITNSSSEVFVFKSDLDIDFLYDLIKEHYDNHFLQYDDPKYDEKLEHDYFCYNTCSGMAGEMNLGLFDEDTAKQWGLGPKYDVTKGNVYMLDIDHNSKATIEWIHTQFKDVERID